MSTLRHDLALVADLIEPNSRVLDLGCGGGDLLEHLMRVKRCGGTGVEIDAPSVLEAIRRGVPVIELDLDSQLGEFQDRSYDVVVLSRTIQTIYRPSEVLSQMARIAPRLIVSVPNFGWWGHRFRLLRGRMPMSKELPFAWYDTPNIRHTTLVDLERLFPALGLHVEQRITLSSRGTIQGRQDPFANLLAGSAVYVLVADV